MRTPLHPAGSAHQNIGVMLRAVSVERAGDDLIVTWDGGTAARVTVGPSPDEAGPVEVEPAEAGRVVIGGLDPAVRHYVRVESDGQAIVAGERLVPLQGTMNFRDLGGYATGDGRRVRWGRVYRSDGLDQLTAADADYLLGLGIKLVCDFRNDREVELAPSQLPDDPGLERQRYPIGGDAAESRSMIERIVAGEVTEYGGDLMAELYGELLEGGAEQLGSVIAHASDPDRHPLLYHCTAGKDRTGVLSALLLGALGVGDDDILDDYELTTHYRSGRRVAQLRPQLEAAGVDVEAVLPFLTAQRPVMAATLDALRERHGSVDAYLTGPAGLDATTLTRLREVLLHAPNP